MNTLIILVAGLQVHEWGVILQNPLSLTGTPDPYVQMVDPSAYELEDKAPVVYFHGDPCVIDLRITFPDMGYATAVVPEPNDGGTGSTYAVWNRLELTDSINDSFQQGWPMCEQSGLPAPVWRQVNALDIAAYGRADRFLYYECVPGSPGDLPFISQSGNQSIRMPYGEIPCLVLTFSDGRPMYGVFTLADIIESIPKGLQFLDDPAALRREVWRWADGILFEDEFDAFWNTWESSFLEDCTENVMILYPVPREIIDGMAVMDVTTDDQSEVVINRFLVAALPYRTR